VIQVCPLSNFLRARSSSLDRLQKELKKSKISKCRNVESGACMKASVDTVNAQLANNKGQNMTVQS